MVYFLIPAYEEEQTIGLLLYKIRSVMQTVRRDYLAIVLDDGSRDATAKVAERYRKFLPVRVLKHANNNGVGPALDRLVREACRLSRYPQRDIAITIEGDFSWSPDPVPDMVRQIEAGADIVIGARERPDRPSEAMPFSRRAGARVVSTVLKAVMPLQGVTDYTSTFRAYRISTLKQAITVNQENLITYRDNAANVELLLRLGRLHPSIAEVSAPTRCDIRTRESRHEWHGAVKSQLSLTGRVGRAPAARG
jgi:dolichol-phosphate mannosyltransferase